jgi:hypothetical protein
VAVTFKSEDSDDEPLACQFTVNGVPTGPTFRTTIEDENFHPGFATITAVLAEQPQYTPSYPGSYYKQLEEKDLECWVDENGGDEEEVFAVAQSVQIVYQPHFLNQYANVADGSVYGYQARNIKRITK